MNFAEALPPEGTAMSMSMYLPSLLSSDHDVRSVCFFLPGPHRYFARGDILVSSSSIYILKYLQLKYTVSKLQKHLENEEPQGIVGNDDFFIVHARK